MIKKLLRILFPDQCVGCKITGTNFCEACLEKCNFDSTISKHGDKSFSSLISCFHYQNKKVKALIAGYKFRYILDLEKLLASLLTRALKESGLAPELNSQYIVTFVPLHKRRKRERGFNQAERLASLVAKAQVIKIVGALERIKFSRPQSELNRKERLENLKGHFRAKNQSALSNKSVILIDDVCTTGSTLNECSKQLINAGAKKVVALVLAKA